MIKGSQQVSAVITHDLAWLKVACDEPPPSLGLESFQRLRPSVATVSQADELQHSVAAFIQLGLGGNARSKESEDEGSDEEVQMTAF